MQLKNIGIALSGGGIRAMIFHLGLFKWLAEQGLFEEVRNISSVSGASLAVGMIYAHNRLEWPSSDAFLKTVLPSIERAMELDLQCSTLLRLIVSPSYWKRKVNAIARTLEIGWGVHGSLSQLRGDPVWYVNCTTYETGKRFTFCKDSMGDYVTGYVRNPDIPISEVMAASAGFPALIGPYSLETKPYRWEPSPYASSWQPPADGTLHLWDGGVYDNFGLESVFKPDGGGTLSQGLDFVIVSNASASIGYQKRTGGISAKNLMRLLNITMDQVASLRSRDVMDYIKRTGRGMYVKIGGSAEKIATDSGCPEEEKRRLIERCLPAEQAIRAMNHPTTLSKPSAEDYRMLLRHGYETALCTYDCYLKYSNSTKH